MIDVYVLNQNLERIDVIDYYTSLIWANRYNDIGDCELYVEANEELLNNVLVVGNYLEREDDDMICRIEKVELTTDAENGDFLTVVGYDLKKILYQRIIWTTTYSERNTELFLRKLVTNSLISSSIPKRNIEGFHLGERKHLVAVTDEDSEQVTYANLGEKIASKCVELEWGFKVSMNNGLQFDLYKGVDRSAEVVFSDDYENLASSTYSNDEGEIVNVALVGGMGEGSNRFLETVGDAEGLARHEVFIDSDSTTDEITYGELKAMFPTGTIQYEGTTMTKFVVDGEDYAYAPLVSNPPDNFVFHLFVVAYRLILKSKGKEEIAQYKSTVSFEGQIEPDVTFKYKEDYNLGDLVTVENKYNIRARARIVEIVETFDENGYTIEPRFEYKGE